ncbi:DUF362 domain-containing protein [bacterium]|nr:DUF362 domain-containing protein [bacterium]
MGKKIPRRDFLKKSMSLGLGSVLGGPAVVRLLRGSGWNSSGESVVSVVQGTDYMKSTLKAVHQLGGMSHFIPPNAKVALLPNAQSNHPGTYTKPEIVRAVIRMCKEAGASEVGCLSWLKMKNWEKCGLKKAVEEEGAELVLVGKEEKYFKAVPVPQGKSLQEARVMKKLYDYDLFIDMPITKHHAGNKFTGTLKNLMGLNSPTCNRTFHKENWTTDPEALAHLDQCIADLNTVIKPRLCVVDATEFITTNGPFGPGKLLEPQRVVAGTDRVAVDSYCTTLMGMKPPEIIMIQRAHVHGLGKMDLSKVKVTETKV